MSATIVDRRQKKLKLLWLKCQCNFRFFGRMSQSQQKLAKKSLILQYSFPQKDPTHYTMVNSISVIKAILTQHSQKHASGWCQKKAQHI